MCSFSNSFNMFLMSILIPMKRKTVKEDCYSEIVTCTEHHTGRPTGDNSKHATAIRQQTSRGERVAVVSADFMKNSVIPNRSLSVVKLLVFVAV